MSSNYTPLTAIPAKPEPFIPRTGTVTPKNLLCLNVENMHNADDAYVIFEDIHPCCGRVILTSFQSSWTAYWNSLAPGETVLQRFMTATPDEITHSLQFGTPVINYRDRNLETAYLAHLCKQIQIAIKKAGMLT